MVDTTVREVFFIYYVVGNSITFAVCTTTVAAVRHSFSHRPTCLVAYRYCYIVCLLLSMQ